MRNKYDQKAILKLCDGSIFTPSMKAQTALNELCRYFLGEDWYSTSGVTHPEQINVEIIMEIEKSYKGAKIKHKGIYKR